MSKRSEYYDKLKDPRWQKKRLEILERDGWKCRWCCDKDNTLHVHHIIYLAGKDPWDIPNGLLITLCESCHKPEELDSKPTEAIVDFIGSMMSTILNKSKEGFPLTMKMVDEALEVLPEQAPCRGGFKYSKAQK